MRPNVFNTKDRIVRQCHRIKHIFKIDLHKKKKINKIKDRKSLKSSFKMWFAIQVKYSTEVTLGINAGFNLLEGGFNFTLNLSKGNLIIRTLSVKTHWHHQPDKSSLAGMVTLTRFRCSSLQDFGNTFEYIRYMWKSFYVWRTSIHLWPPRFCPQTPALCQENGRILLYNILWRVQRLQELVFHYRWRYLRFRVTI